MSQSKDGNNRGGLFARLKQLFAPEAASPPPVLAKAAPPPQQNNATSRHVFRFVLKRNDPTIPPGQMHILAEAYYEDIPGQRRKYGTDFHAGASILDMLEAQAAVAWKQSFDSGECNEAQAIRWLQETRQAIGPDYLKELPADDFKESHLFRGLSKVAAHMMISSVGAPNAPEAFATLFGIQSAREPFRRHHAQDLLDAPRFAAAHRQGQLNPDFCALIRKSTGFF
jgi:hypothetical protein